ncbi:MAG: hypothetical protein H2015_03375 [Chloroflexi bacterium]|nr:hypothetical protein [Chloroflexota bacterium]|tara:strand:- start:2144 stop:2503 length:360 start_codon:yes stop_codon:yes gene_type:complete
MEKDIVTMDIKKGIIIVFSLMIFSCSNYEYEKELENCISAITTILISHNHDVTALTPRSIKTLPPRNYYPEFPDPMTEPDEYWNPGAKRTFKLIEDNCPAKFYDEKVINESKSFINYGN